MKPALRVLLAFLALAAVQAAPEGSVTVSGFSSEYDGAYEYYSSSPPSYEGAPFKQFRSGIRAVYINDETGGMEFLTTYEGMENDPYPFVNDDYTLIVAPQADGTWLSSPMRPGVIFSEAQSPSFSVSWAGGGFGPGYTAPVPVPESLLTGLTYENGQWTPLQ